MRWKTSSPGPSSGPAITVQTDFLAQELPFGPFGSMSGIGTFHDRIAIGDQVIDLAALHDTGVFDGAAYAAHR